MFGSTVLDVVIGLVFIYLLYSLFATVLQEIIATIINLRSEILKKGIARMLDDEVDNKDLSDAFYNHPLIKYLGENKRFNRNGKPAYLSSKNFAKVLIDLLRGDDFQPGQSQNPLIQQALNSGKILWEGGAENDNDKIGTQTLRYIKSLWADAQGDVEKFSSLLEQWFNDTMERVSGWYKKKVQIILFFIGFFIAISFNVDTISIAKKLSTDKGARDQLVSMANAYVQNNRTVVFNKEIDSTDLKDYNQKIDSLLEVKKVLNTDIKKANTILGLGGWPPDSVEVTIHSITKNNSIVKVKNYSPLIDEISLSKSDQKEPSKIYFTFCKRLGYLCRLTYHHLGGFFITALAISLGAPFWFDLLNKLMKLRSSVTDSSTEDDQKQENTQSPTINRVG